jgi:uncharacterized membrane protein
MVTQTNSSPTGDRGDGQPWPDEINVHPFERSFSVGLGLSFGLLGLIRRGLTGAGLAALGGMLVHRGMTGHCPVYTSLRVSTAHGVRAPSASVAHGRGIRVKHSRVIHRSPAELFKFWRELENLPRFMVNVESITPLDERRSRWRVRGPLDSVIAWDAEIINEVQDELIAWRSLPGSLVATAGSVRFQPALGELGTRVTVTLEYDPPVGVVGATIARWLGVDPARQVDEDLHRFKVLMEGGEAPAVGAQWRGKLSEVPDLESARELLKDEGASEEGASERAEDESLH